MTIAQMAHRLAAANLNTAFTTLPGEWQLLLLDAIHTGFGEYFSMVPLRYREKTHGMRFGAKQTGTVAVTAGSKVATFTGVTPVDGATVEISGDDIINRAVINPDISAPGTYLLEIPYGGTTGSKSVTVYRDTAVIPWDISCLVSHPKDARNDAFELEPVPHGVSSDSPVMGYRIERTQQSTVLRVIPPPESDLALSCVVEIENITIGGIESVTTTSATAVPVSDDHCIRLVLPLCAAALTHHPDWKNPQLVQSVMLAAERARADIRLLRGKTVAGFNQIVSSYP